ncbi:MAG: hypothetical protein E7571_02415 [Ruminococcaceae bacterium]|nr:hypothetical protein [Oscillospiraceae bacterium]
MNSFIEYINSVLPDDENDTVMYKFKKKTYDEMNERKSEVSARGIHNEKVIDDLIISEHPNLQKEFEEYSAKERAKAKAKRNVILNTVGSVIYLIATVVIYLAISFSTHDWGTTWAIIVDGVLIWVGYILFLGVKRITEMRRIFHIFARILLAGMNIVLTVAVFIFIIATTDLPKSWVTIIFGLISMFVCDGAFAVLMKHKFAIINCLLYIPVIATFTFIIFGALEVMKWSIAWIIIPLSLIVDLVVILIAIAKNKQSKLEVADIWNEN